MCMSKHRANRCIRLNSKCHLKLISHPLQVADIHGTFKDFIFVHKGYPTVELLEGGRRSYQRAWKWILVLEVNSCVVLLHWTKTQGPPGQLPWACP